MRSSTLIATAIALSYACAGRDKPGQPARLSAGASDTIIVNDYGPIPLPVLALDAAGHPLQQALIRYERTSGTDLTVSSTGVMTCARRGDLGVQAVLGPLSKSFFVRCRPIARLDIPGPVQFVLGDSALSQPIEVPLAAYDSSGRPVMLLAGFLRVLGTPIATARGSMLIPDSQGVALLGAWAGHQNARTGLHIYKRVEMATLDTLRRVDGDHRQIAVPIRVRRGEELRLALPRGEWMVTTFSADQAPDAFRMRFEHASCTPNLLNDPQRFGCRTSTGARVIVSRHTVARDTSAITGYLLVRGFYPPLPPDTALR
jgi:hypothetical protein